MKNSDFLVWRQRRRKDPFKISYECHREPLIGARAPFSVGEVYNGRYYNGLYEVSTNWGREEAYQLRQKEFDAYFKLIEEPQKA
ncbi:MAG: hypothetical protein WA958_13460 [Tunicatimonas sp.]